MENNQKWKPMKLFVFLLLFLILSQGCSPRKGVPYTEPLSAEEEEVYQGKVLYDQFCNKCHPGGAAGLGPALNNKPLPGFLIRFQIRNGLGAMPAFDENHISDEEVDKIVAYMKILRRLDEK